MYTQSAQYSTASPLGGRTVYPAITFRSACALLVTCRAAKINSPWQRSLHRIRGIAIVRLLLAASFAWISPPVQAQVSEAPPQTSWQPYGSIMHSLQQMKGSMIAGVLDTSSELLTSNMTFNVYKASQTGSNNDYYMIAGPFSHAVTPATNNGNGAGWSTSFYSSQYGGTDGVGWCGANMVLNVAGTTADGITPTNVSDFGPESAGDLSSTTTQVGGNLSGLSAGVSYEHTITWDAPDVAIWTYNTDTNGVPNIVNYSAGLRTCDLPSSYSTGNWYPNPDPASKFGTALQIAIVYQVPHGRGLQVNWNNDVWWHAFYQNFSTGPTKVNQNIYGAGAFVADFGAAPTFNAGGTENEPANGPEIVDAYGDCITAEPLLGMASNGISYSRVLMQTCDKSHANAFQKWYYTANSQIVNVQTGNCLDIEGGYSQGGTPVAGSRLATAPCGPTLPTAACLANGTCPTGNAVVSQQWQLTSSPSVSGNSTNNSLFLVSSSGYVVNANPDTSRYTIESPEFGTCFVLPLDSLATPNPAACSNTPTH